MDICIIILSKEIHIHLLNTFECEQIAEFTACNGNTPIYKMNYKGREIGFYLSPIGSAMASGICSRFSRRLWSVALIRTEIQKGNIKSAHNFNLL